VMFHFNPKPQFTATEEERKTPEVKF
jgi:hypothetical protein